MYFLYHINGAFSRSLGYNGGMPAELDEATPLRPQYREKITPYFKREMGSTETSSSQETMSYGEEMI